MIPAAAPPSIFANPVVVLALIAMTQLVILAILNELLQARKEKRAAALKKAEKDEDDARQDARAEKAERKATELAEQADKKAEERAEKVARQAREAAALLATAQAETIARTEEVARVAAANDVKVQQQLHAIDEQGKKIHILVNSDMTAARENERDSMKVTLLALKKIRVLHEQAGVTFDPEDEEEIAKTEARILELDGILADRHQAQLAVDAEARASGTSATPTDPAKHG
jgi:hypothetical protein